ncbi:hypothetical protein BGZ82_010358, partial [Podila clonocystis]
MSFHKRTNSTPSQQQTLPSPLVSLPEVLEQVFGHVSQANLRYSVSYVCRLWYSVAKLLITHSVSYRCDQKFLKDVEESAKCMDLANQLTGASILELSTPTIPHFSRTAEGTYWRTIFGAITKVKADNPLKLQSLIVRHNLSWNLNLEPLLCQLPQLTTLRLRWFSSATLPLQEILVCCPSLTHVSVHSNANSRVQQETRNDLVNDRPMALQTLSLKEMFVEEEALDTILERCPFLRELHLIKLRQPRQPTYSATVLQSDTGPRLVSIHNMDFFHRIAFHCRNLNSLHISQDNQHVLTATCLMEIWSLFPKLTHWSFLGDNTPAALLSSLVTRHQDPVLTSLEITEGMLDNDSQILLHEFLCQAPHLVHLNLATFVPIDRLDLEGNLLSNGWYRHRGDPETYMPGPHYTPHKQRTKKIWACRRLKTLVLNFSNYYNQNDGPDVCRLVHGYLSKVCPDLEEIVFRRKFLNPRLESGMILLSRLKKLRRLVWVVGYKFGSTLKDRDLEWITRDMTSKMHRWQLMMIPRVLKAENHFLDQVAPFKSNKDHIIDGINMKNIGRLYDIVDVIRDRAANKWTCWPQLEQWNIVTERQGSNSVDMEFFGD